MEDYLSWVEAWKKKLQNCGYYRVNKSYSEVVGNFKKQIDFLKIIPKKFAPRLVRETTNAVFITIRRGKYRTSRDALEALSEILAPVLGNNKLPIITIKCESKKKKNQCQT